MRLTALLRISNFIRRFKFYMLSLVLSMSPYRTASFPLSYPTSMDQYMVNFFLF